MPKRTIEFNQLLQKKTITERLEWLKNIRQQLMATEASSDPQRPNYLLFRQKQHGPLFDRRHLLARGIDVLVGGLAILDAPDQSQWLALNSDSSDEAVPNASALLMPTNKPDQMLGAFAQFLKELNELDDTIDDHGMQKAIQSLGQLNTAMCGITENKWKAVGIAREIEYKKNFGLTAFATSLGAQGVITVTPLRLTPRFLIPFYTGEQPWIKRLKKIGLENFIAKNFSRLGSGQTPQMQYLPSPIAAYQSTYNKFSLTSTGITEPYEIPRNKLLEQFRLDPYIKKLVIARHHLLFGDQDRLQQFVTDYYERYPHQSADQTELTIPILHQTLITDTVPFSPDSAKTAHAIRYKMAANHVLRQTLADANYHVTTEGILRNVKKGDALPGGSIKVTFVLLETNNCVNRHHKYSKVRNHDIAHARKLVALARQRLAQQQTSANESDVQVILKFLASNDYSLFTPYKARGPRVKAALATLGSKKNDLGLLAAAAVELKCTVHETWLGAARRRLHNTLPAIPGLRWVGVAVSFVLSNLIKLITAPVLMAHWAKHHDTRRKTLAKSNYEQLVTALLGGQVIGSCMSGVDRLQETWLRSVALLQGYQESGKLLGYNDAPKDVEALLTKYAPSLMQHKRHFAGIQTGVPANQEQEMCAWFGKAGLLQEHLGEVTQKTPKAAAQLRKLPKKKYRMLSALFARPESLPQVQLPLVEFSNTPSKP